MYSIVHLDTDGIYYFVRSWQDTRRVLKPHGHTSAVVVAGENRFSVYVQGEFIARHHLYVYVHTRNC